VILVSQSAINSPVHASWAPRKHSERVLGRVATGGRVGSESALLEPSFPAKHLGLVAGVLAWATAEERGGGN
jgi:hypothetical protein